MTVTVTDAPEQRRCEARVDGELAAFADDIPTGELLAFTHTEVLPAFEGKGVGSALVPRRWTTWAAGSAASWPSAPS